ncbi:MAG: 2-dehydropantoate 2-reductase [Dactylosporangium sp.]|nr:2-dehydropantoate 2-reductase [Dactylosporangium sp.]NNJ61895.1 2-dehydropantoate 2-reductase [Dactylosporangium sp.]
MKIAVIGAGAVGSVLGGLLARAGEDVILVGRQPHVDLLNDHGLIIDGASDRMTIRLRATPRLDVRPDLALLTVKTQDLPAALEEYSALLRGVPVVVTQNGVRADQMAADVLGRQHVVGCVVLFGATYLEPGRVTCTLSRGVVVGEPFAQRIDPRTRTVAALLGRAVPVSLAADLPGARWTKLVVNETNALPAITGGSAQDVFADGYLRDLTVVLMAEAVGTLRAAGIGMASLPGTPAWALASLLRLPGPLRRVPAALLARSTGVVPILGSTLQSIRRGVTTEIDYLCGEVVTLGARIGRATPYNSAMVDLVHRVEDTGEHLTAWQVRQAIDARESPRTP